MVTKYKSMINIEQAVIALELIGALTLSGISYAHSEHFDSYNPLKTEATVNKPRQSKESSLTKATKLLLWGQE